MQTLHQHRDLSQKSTASSLGRAILGVCILLMVTTVVFITGPFHSESSVVSTSLAVTYDEINAKTALAIAYEEAMAMYGPPISDKEAVEDLKDFDLGEKNSVNNFKLYLSNDVETNRFRVSGKAKIQLEEDGTVFFRGQFEGKDFTYDVIATPCPNPESDPSAISFYMSTQTGQLFRTCPGGAVNPFGSALDTQYAPYKAFITDTSGSTINKPFFATIDKDNYLANCYKKSGFCFTSGACCPSIIDA